MIQKTVDLIKQTRNFELDADQIPIDDLNTFNFLGRGQLEGITVRAPRCASTGSEALESRGYFFDPGAVSPRSLGRWPDS